MNVISIKNIIDVSSSIAPTAQARRSFYYATVVQKVAGGSNKTRFYSSASEVMENEGSNSAAYKFAVKYFSGGFGGIKPSGLYVSTVNSTGLTNSTQGFFTSGSASSNLASFQEISDGSITISKDGSSAIEVANIDFTSASSLDDVASIMQEKICLEEIFRNLTISYSAPNFIIKNDSYGSDSVITISAGVTGTNLLGASYFNGGTSTDGTEGTLTNLINTFLDDSSYYHICLANGWSDQEVLQWSYAVQSATKITYLLWALSTDSAIANQSLSDDTDSLARTLFDLKASKTVLIYDSTNLNYKQASLPSYFGIVDFSASVARSLGCLAFKQFSGQLPTSLTDSQYKNLLSKNVNFYGSFGEVGRNIAYCGKTCSGQFIHDVIAVDYIDYNMTYNIFDMMISLPRLGYTEEDFAKLYNAIELALISALNTGIIAGGTDPDSGSLLVNGYSISIPKPSTISSQDKANGIVNGVTVVGLLKGAAIKFVVTNTLKL